MGEMLWPSPEIDFTANAQAIIRYDMFENYNSKIIAISRSGKFS